MKNGEKFKFDEARTARERMDELERFITFWLGPRQPEYGVSEAELSKRAMPEPLRRLYGFAGRWPTSKPECAGAANVFCVQDSLRAFEDLQTSSDGKLLFVVENQGNWNCGTLAQGEDPPVWVEDHFSEGSDGEWVEVCDSLSRFLVSFCLTELLFHSRECGTKKNLASRMCAEQLEREVVCTDVPYAFCSNGRNFFLIADRHVLAGNIWGSDWWFGGNSDRGVAFLKENRGNITELSISAPTQWYLAIYSDGSGEVGVADYSDSSSAKVPAGTFKFSSVLDLLMDGSFECDTGAAEGAVLFPRSENGLFGGRALRDMRVARELFQVALQARVSEDAGFARLLQERPPRF